MSNFTTKKLGPSINTGGGGGGGNGGGDAVFYTHAQNTAAATWNIQHNFGAKPVTLWLYDASGNEMYGEPDAKASTPNLLLVRFGIATSGTAIVRGN
jgi:hypothetical protein